MRLRSAILNEGLEVLGARERIREREISGSSFTRSGLESIRLPSTLKVVEDSTFVGCRDLRSIEFSEGLEEICLGAFLDSGLESVCLPKSLRVLRQAAFAKCEHLRTAVLNEGLQALGMDEYSGDG